jgi:hypothetical protein
MKAAVQTEGVNLTIITSVSPLRKTKYSYQSLSLVTVRQKGVCDDCPASKRALLGTEHPTAPACGVCGLSHLNWSRTRCLSQGPINPLKTKRICFI